jgi:hypothetical protein
MTANAIFFGARHGVGPPRHLFTSLDGATRLQKTLGGSKFGMEPTAIWGMSVAKPVNLADPDVSELVRQLIDTANDLAPRGSGETKS